MSDKADFAKPIRAARQWSVELKTVCQTAYSEYEIFIHLNIPTAVRMTTIVSICKFNDIYR